MDRLQKRGAPAFAALSPAGRAVLTAVENEIARARWRCGADLQPNRAACRHVAQRKCRGLRQIEMLGFVCVDMGSSPQFHPHAEAGRSVATHFARTKPNGCD